MTNLLSLIAGLSDTALVARVTSLAERERQTTAELIALLAELDARRLYLGAGCAHNAYEAELFFGPLLVRGSGVTSESTKTGPQAFPAAAPRSTR